MSNTLLIPSLLSLFKTKGIYFSFESSNDPDVDVMRSLLTDSDPDFEALEEFVEKNPKYLDEVIVLMHMLQAADCTHRYLVLEGTGIFCPVCNIWTLPIIRKINSMSDLKDFFITTPLPPSERRYGPDSDAAMLYIVPKDRHRR